jgi:hypothetical protein
VGASNVVHAALPAHSASLESEQGGLLET